MAGWGNGQWGLGLWGLGLTPDPNLSFEIEGDPGFPAEWTLATTSTLRTGLFGTTFPNTFDTFASDWDTDTFTTTFIGSNAIFTPLLAADSFEVGWGNGPLGFFGIAATFVQGSAEDFESGWDNDTFTLVFSGTDAVFTGAGQTNAEDFESGWDNDTFTLVFSGTAAEWGLFPASTETFESFEQVKSPRTFTVVPGSPGTITMSSHGMISGEGMFFQNDDGRLPLGLTGAKYYLSGVSNVNQFTIQPSFPALTQIDIDDQGLGTHFLIRDPVFWWSEELSF
jgi:hypothetical protein